MINYFFIQLKNKLFGRKNLLIFMAVILLSVGLTYIYHSVGEENIYKVGIIDYDQSETSMAFTQLLKNQDEIDLTLETAFDTAQRKLKRGDYHILYTIKNGFEETLMSGEYKDVLGYSKESSMQMTAWLNDFISLKVLKEWAYYDLYNLIDQRSSGQFTLEDYEKAYMENLDNNEIISLEIENLSIKEKPSGEEEKIFVSIVSIFMMLVTMSYGKEIISENQMNIVNRLKVSGISELKYLMIKGIILLIYLITILIISAIILIGLGVFKDFTLFKNILAFTCFIAINYMVIILFTKLLKEKGKYLLVTQGYILFSVLMSSDLFKGNLPLVNQVKGFFPLTYLLDIIL
jgi:hypothetical protein